MLFVFVNRYRGYHIPIRPRDLYSDQTCCKYPCWLDHCSMFIRSDHMVSEVCLLHSIGLWPSTFPPSPCQWAHPGNSSLHVYCRHSTVLCWSCPSQLSSTFPPEREFKSHQVVLFLNFIKLQTYNLHVFGLDNSFVYSVTWAPRSPHWQDMIY